MIPSQFKSAISNHIGKNISLESKSRVAQGKYFARNACAIRFVFLFSILTENYDLLFVEANDPAAKFLYMPTYIFPNFDRV